MKRPLPMLYLFLAVSLGLVAISTAMADEQADPKAEAIRNSLSTFLPRLKVDSVRATPVPGIYEVVFGSQLFYVAGDGRFLIQGQIFDLEQQQDLTKPRLSQLRTEMVAGIGEENMLTYEPAETKYQVTVFTDIDCPYCRKMHAQMDEYLARGIRVRYLLFPRAGKDSKSYDKAVSVWCSDDRQAAMNQAKSGVDLPKRDCAHPVDKHMEIGGRIPIRGTPAMVLDNGDILPGYLPPDALLVELQSRGQKQ